MTGSLAGPVTRLATSQRDSGVIAALTEALVASQDRLHVLQALLRLDSTSLESQELMHQVMAEALELTGSDVAVVADGGAVLVVGRPEPATAGLRDRVLAEARRSPAAADGADAGPVVVTLEGGTGVVTRLDDNGTGPAALGFARACGPRYSTGDLQLVDAVRTVAERLRELARLHRDAVRRATVEREHQLASSLAQAMLPAAAPRLPGVEVFARSEPAQLAGGDFMSFEVANGLLWLAVGDVAGKGLPAAIVMTRAMSATRAAFLSTGRRDPTAAMQAVNEEMHAYLDDVGLFVTMAVAVYQPGCGFIQLCNAGHSPVLTVVGGRALPVAPSVPPLGVIKALRPRTCHLPVPPGATVVIGSDGLVEQPDAAGRLFGYDRFVRACVQGRSDPVDRLGERLFARVRLHACGTPAADDRTLVLLRTTTGR